MPDASSQWNTRYESVGIVVGKPARVLEENAHLLPNSGKALDLACGLGANALWLAGRGMQTSAWDISDVAIGKLRDYVLRLDLKVYTQVRDVVSDPPLANSFDVIVVSRFLERGLMPHLVNALNTGGLVFYQTFIQYAVSDTGPSNPAYRLRSNELLTLFKRLRVLVYREEGTVGNLDQGYRDEAMFVGLKL